MLQFKAFLASQPSLPCLHLPLGLGQIPRLPLVILERGQLPLTPEPEGLLCIALSCSRAKVTAHHPRCQIKAMALGTVVGGPLDICPVEGDAGCPGNEHHLHHSGPLPLRVPHGA